ncbi:MAG: substrate-binding domain-containing protein, partial [Phormidesmis sp. CAN_BIN44]|nr:substrate-binding domain-containing protein [Phormidesmis sp. CAN_BIN44]
MIIQTFDLLRLPDRPITPLSRNLKAGGTVDFFYEKVLDKTPFGSNVKEVSNTTLAIRQVATTPGSISYATASEVINQKMIRLLALGKDANQPSIAPCTSEDCTTINKAAFGDGSYPLTRRLFV